MKKIISIVSLLLLTACTQNAARIINFGAIIPDCQSAAWLLQEQSEESAEEMGENVWIIDREIFYSPKLKTCIGKYIISRKEGTKNDASLFVIQNMGKREYIYLKKYTEKDAKNEYAGQKSYQAQIVSLR